MISLGGVKLAHPSAQQGFVSGNTGELFARLASLQSAFTNRFFVFLSLNRPAEELRRSEMDRDAKLLIG